MFSIQWHTHSIPQEKNGGIVRNDSAEAILKGAWENYQILHFCICIICPPATLDSHTPPTMLSLVHVAPLLGWLPFMLVAHLSKHRTFLALWCLCHSLGFTFMISWDCLLGSPCKGIQPCLTLPGLISFLGRHKLPCPLSLVPCML